MKKKVVKRLLPFLMALTLAGTTVFAEEGLPVAPANGETAAEETAETAESLETETPDGEEAEDASEVIDDSEAVATPDGSEAGGAEETPDGSEAADPAETPDESEATDPAVDPDDSEVTDPTETPDESGEQDPTEAPDESEAQDSTETPDESEATEPVATPDAGETEEGAGEVTVEGSVIEGETANADAVSNDGYTFVRDNNGVVITGYTGYETNLKIPAVLKAGDAEYNVSGIRNNAFNGNKTLVSVEIPGSLTYIGYRAFQNCISLSRVTIGEGITEIQDHAFLGCITLKSIVVPGTVTTIGEGAFESCKTLASAEVKTNFVAAWMFNDCSSLQKVTLSKETTLIGRAAFLNCVSLTDINIPATLKSVERDAFAGCIALRAITLNEGLEVIKQGVFYSCKALEAIVIPASVKEVGAEVFKACESLREATVRNGLVSYGMFQDCTSLIQVNLSKETATTIGDWAFSGCTALKSITIPNTVTVLGYKSFRACTSLESIKVPASVTTIGRYAFADCQGMKTVEISSNVVGQDMFSGCTALTKVTMLDNVKSIWGGAFYHCDALTDVQFGSNVTEIGDAAFMDCKALVTVNIGSKVVTIGSSAFQRCEKLESVVVPASVKQIYGYAFADCGKLRNVSLVEGLTTISSRAFRGDKNLTTIYIPKSVVVIDGSAFWDTGLGTVYCEQGSVAENLDLYPVGTTIRYGKPTVASPKFAVKGIIGGREVTFNCENKDAVIYYSTTTSNLTTADKSVLSGSKVTFTNFYGPVYARAYVGGEWSSVSKLLLKIPVVATPEITVNKGTVKISTKTPDCIIYYTTDGSEPSPSHGTKVAKSAFTFSSMGGTVKAMAVRSCFTNSGVATRKVPSMVDSSIGVPSFKVKGIIGGRAVTFSSATPGTTIYYSTSSSMSTKDKCVKGGGTVNFSNFYGTIYARAYKDGKWSNPSRLILKIPTIKTPKISWASNGRVKISTATPNCTLYYTTNGTTPSPTNGKVIRNSSSYVTVGYGTTVKVIAVRSCFTNSEVVTYKR